jgi:hypothetical protein
MARLKPCPCYKACPEQFPLLLKFRLRAFRCGLVLGRVSGVPTGLGVSAGDGSQGCVRCANLPWAIFSAPTGAGPGGWPRKNKSRSFDSPPPNWKTFGAPFAQNDTGGLGEDRGHDTYFQAGEYPISDPPGGRETDGNFPPALGRAARVSSTSQHCSWEICLHGDEDSAAANGLRKRHERDELAV